MTRGPLAQLAGASAEQRVQVASSPNVPLVRLQKVSGNHRHQVLPPHVQAEVQRILNAVARRLLAEQMNGDAPTPAAGVDGDPLARGADQASALLQRESIPIAGSDGERDARAA